MLKILKTKVVKTPARGTNGSAGLDFFIPECFEPTLLAPGQSINIPSGIRARIPAGHALVAFNKSGIATKTQMIVGACVVDEDYTGEIHLNLLNVGRTLQHLEPGMKLTQFILIAVNYAGVHEAESEEEIFGDLMTERGNGGFGSTGSK